VDLVVRVTLVQRLGFSATVIVMQASRVRTVGADTTRHSGPLAPLLRRLLQFSIKKSEFGLISQPHAWLQAEEEEQQEEEQQGGGRRGRRRAPWSIWGDRLAWFGPIVNPACLPAAA
jgi:hypothetical protein